MLQVREACSKKNKICFQTCNIRRAATPQELDEDQSLEAWLSTWVKRLSYAPWNRGIPEVRLSSSTFIHYIADTPSRTILRRLAKVATSISNTARAKRDLQSRFYGVLWADAAMLGVPVASLFSNDPTCRLLEKFRPAQAA